MPKFNETVTVSATRRTILRHIVLTVLIIGAVLGTVQAQQSKAIKPVNVDLPKEDRQFSGSDAKAFNNNCVACYSADMVMNQPPLSRANWKAEVRKMIKVTRHRSKRWMLNA